MRGTKPHNKNSVGGVFSSTGAKTSSLTGKARSVWMISSLKDFNSGTLRGQETMNQRCTYIAARSAL